MRFALAALWGLIVLAGLIGWGSLLGRLFRRNETLPLGLSGAIGFSFGVVIGGVLGLFHLILPATVIVFVVLGLPLLMFRRSAEEKIPTQKSPRILLAILIPLLACRYLSAVHQTDFQTLDDVPAYLVYPVKMLQTGEFGPDPYSDRRMNGLGGQQWSQSLVIAPFDPTVINLFDHGIAVLLLLLICWDWLISIGINRRFGMVVLLTLTLTYPNYVNTASFVTISALLLAIFVVLTDRLETPGDAILLALLVAGICSLKTTVIPLIGSILTVRFILAAIKNREIRTLLFAAGVATLTGIFLFPWMMSMHQSSNTFLAPLLGRGNSTLESLTSSVPSAITIAELLMSTGCVLCGVLIFICLRNDPTHRSWAMTAAIFPIVTAPIIFIIAEMTGGLGWMRYPQPFIYGWIALPITACWIAGDRGWMPGRPIALTIALVAIGQSFGWARPGYFHDSAAMKLLCGPPQVIGRQCELIADGIRWKPAISAPAESSTRVMQATVPAGAAILTRVDFPHLFDFSRNPVFIADHPGLAYPPPGLPPTPTPQALRAFLLDHGIRYVAYSYGNQANYSHADAIPAHMTYAWDRAVAERTFGFQDALSELMKSQRIIYDDRVTAVIDLGAGKTP